MATDTAPVQEADTAASTPDIRLAGVRKLFGEVVAVDGVDLDISRGEFFTLLGPSGSGKTTCLRMIAGFERPDEPLGALDLKLRQQLQVELKRIQNEVGITFVYVTHDQDEALTMSDRIAVMDGGRVLQVGTPRDVYEEPGSRFVAGFVGVSNL